MHAPRRLGRLVATAALVGACRHATPGPAPEHAPAPALAGSSRTSAAPTPLEHGRASYYADSLAGRPTASGERYDPRALTAAHRTLPFGTWVDVVRPDGRRVRVRVNDRGPFKAGRVIDLSRAAAETLGMVSAGVVEVELYRVP